MAGLIMSLVEKIKQARVLRIKVGEMTFIARRPTVEEYSILAKDSTRDPDIARRFVTGWENVKELDLFPGGGEEQIAFDADLWSEAVGDLPEIWREIVGALITATNEYIKKLGTAEKN